MARINAKGRLSGSTGPVYYRTYNGKAIVQSKPGKGGVKQTGATKLAASDFGRASITAKNIRNGLLPALLGMQDTQMFRRFTAKVHAAAIVNTDLPKGSRALASGDLSLLDDFDFNSNTSFDAYCRVTPTLERSVAGLMLRTPAFNAVATITAPPMATGCEVSFIALYADAGTGMCIDTQAFRFETALNNREVAAAEWALDLPSEDQLLFVTVAVIYFRDGLSGRISLNSRELHPCKLVEVVAAEV